MRKQGDAAGQQAGILIDDTSAVAPCIFPGVHAQK